MEEINSAKRINSTFPTKSKNMIKQVTNLAMDNVDDDEWKNCSLLQLETSMKNCIKADVVVEEMYKFMGDLFSKSENDESFQFSDYLQKFENKKEEVKSSDMESHYNDNEDLQSIRSIIKQMDACKEENFTVSDEDDDVMTTQQDVNLIDPISKKLMEDPVRHSRCGHVYDRSSIMQLIKQGRRRGASCPYMGCGYRQALNPQDFEVALDYRKEIQKRKRLGTYN